MLAEYGVAATREAAARIPVGDRARSWAQYYVSNLDIGRPATCHHGRLPHIPTVRRTAPRLESAITLRELRRWQESVDNPAIGPATAASQRIGRRLGGQRPPNN